jgi:hypothetical protein
LEQRLFPAKIQTDMKIETPQLSVQTP